MQIAFCCVADEKTKYLTQAVRWAWSIRRFAESLADALIVVGMVGDCPPAYREEFERLGARLVPLPQASTWHGPSNKLGVLDSAELRDADVVVLTDCDVVFVDDPAPEFSTRNIRAKPADLATLGNDVLEAVFLAAGVQAPSARLVTTVDRVALIPYCNSGVVVLPAPHRDAFVADWLRWNRFMLQRSDLLGQRSFFTDQASFALALSHHMDEFDPLPATMNFPCHLPLTRYPEDLAELEPKVLHYHDRVDGKTGLLRKVGLPGVDRAVARFNEAVRQDRAVRLNNGIFWDERYLREPDLGSGIGSRGEHVSYKRELAREFLAAEQKDSIVDLGCGDCAILDGWQPAGYLGVDASREVITRNRGRFPWASFMEGSLPSCKFDADLSLCFDVLIHQSQPDLFEKVIDAVVQGTRHAGLINGFDADPGFDSDIVYYHRHLGEALRDRGLDVVEVGTFRKTTIYRWRKR